MVSEKAITKAILDKGIRNESPRLLSPACQLSEAFFDTVRTSHELRIRAFEGWN
jgi:hypothetical protein